jgi:hypothetical protein
VNVERSADNPSGLLVGEYWSKQIEGEQRNAVLLDSALNGNSGNSDAPVATVTTDGGGQQ